MGGATAEDDPSSLIRSFTLPLSRRTIPYCARCVSVPAYLPSTSVFPPFEKKQCYAKCRPSLQQNMDVKSMSNQCAMIDDASYRG
jgi:hypothetical protein